MFQLPNRKSKLDWERIDAVISSGVESGRTYAQIAESLGVSYTTVLNRATKFGIGEHHKNGFNISAERIMMLYKSGMKQKQIAEECGCSLSTVTITVRKSGCRRRNDPLDTDEVLFLLEQGCTFEQVSIKIGKSINYIYYKRNKDPEFKRLTDEARAFGKALNKEIAG